MKKVLSTALALGLVASVAGTAAAYDKFDVSGYYTVQGFYADSVIAGEGVHLGMTGDTGEWHAAFWRQDMRLYPNLTINDKTRLKSEIRLMDTDLWGTSDTTAGPGAGRMADINKLYMEWDSPMGLVRIGRIPFGTYGHTSFNNSAGREDGIVWGTNFLPKPFSLTLVTAKLDEMDAGLVTQTIGVSTTVSFVPVGTSTNAAVVVPVTTTGKANDADNDWYSVHLDYKTDTAIAGTRLVLVDNQLTPTTNFSDWRIQGYGKVSMDNLWFGGEFTHRFGTMDFDAVGTPDTDLDSWAVLAQAGTKLGKVDATLSYWWISGDDNPADNDNEAYGDADNDWQPLLIMTHEHMELLNNKHGAGSYNVGTGATRGDGDTVQSAGANVIMAQFTMPVSDKMTINSALAYGWADAEATNYDDEYGYEIDLGMSYKILDNLTYGLNFGYFDAGDFFTQGNNTMTADDSIEDSVFLLHHSLNMTF